MKNTLKTIGYISIIPLLIGLFFFDNIKGYYRFKELCKQESQLVVTKKLERDVGWQLDLGKPTSQFSALVIASLPYVRFVRFRNSSDNQIYDMYYVGKTNRVPEIPLDPRNRNGWEHDYENRPANFVNKVTYQWNDFNEALQNELRTNRYGEQIIDLRTKKVVVSLTNIGYALFDRNHTFLDAPSGNTCDWYNVKWRNQNILSVF
ncbi:MAG: hypothetical protein CTY33_05685 [Methylotenera sp.]|nr:MAG: hypothetical protein CTY33_05685 [Methylotenera sp.]